MKLCYFLHTPASVNVASHQIKKSTGCLPFVGKSGWCNRHCIMVRDFPNSSNQPDEIALTIYLSNANHTEKARKWRIHSNGKEFSAVPFRMENEDLKPRLVSLQEYGCCLWARCFCLLQCSVPRYVTLFRKT